MTTYEDKIFYTKQCIHEFVRSYIDYEWETGTWLTDNKMITEFEDFYVNRVMNYFFRDALTEREEQQIRAAGAQCVISLRSFEKSEPQNYPDSIFEFARNMVNEQFDTFDLWCDVRNELPDS
jgi:hypothetical protein